MQSKQASINPLSTRGLWKSTPPSKNGIFKNKFLCFFKDDFKIWLIQKIAMVNIFHLVYSLCLYGQNQLNYKQFSEGSENAEKTLVLKGLSSIWESNLSCLLNMPDPKLVLYLSKVSNVKMDTSLCKDVWVFILCL